MSATEATTVREQDGSLHFTLRMDEAGDLFIAPELDPFRPQLRATAGIEDIADELRARRLKGVAQLDAVLVLPQGRITPALGEDIRGAIVRYCDHEIEAARRRVATTRTTGHTELPITIIVSIGVILLSLVSSWLLQLLLPSISGFVNALLAGLTTITIWVAVWQPVEAIFFAPWEDQRDILIYEKIKDMGIHIEPA